MLVKAQQQLKVLITQKLDKIYKINYKILNDKIQEDIKKWSTLGLNFSARTFRKLKREFDLDNSDLFRYLQLR